MKICYIKTGGTISSAYEGGTIEKGKTDFVLPLLGGDVTVKEPYCILSENADLPRLAALAEALKEGLEGADAAVIAHGTDTLCHTAAVLGAAFAGEKKPVVLVSSAYPPENEKSNARENVEGALNFLQAKGGAEGGVYVSYKNDGEPCALHFAPLLLPPRDFDGYVYSALGLICGYARTDGFCPRYTYRPQRIKGYAENVRQGIARPVRFVSAYPGLDYASLGGEADVLIAGYHSGTVATERGNNINLLAESTKGHVYLVGGTEGVKYASLQRLSPRVRVWNNITPLSAFYALTFAPEPEKAYTALRF